MNTNNISVFLDVALSLTFFYFVTSMFVSGIVEFINTAFENRSYFLWYSLEKLQTLQPTKWKVFQKEEVFVKNDDKTNSVEKPTDNSTSTWFEIFKNHAMIKNLESDKDKWRGTRVSYIHADTFVSVIRDILSKSKSKLDSTTKATEPNKTTTKATEPNKTTTKATEPNKTTTEPVKSDKIVKFEELNQLISVFETGDFKDILQTIANQSKSVKDFEDKLATWYNQYMEQVSGWFKRYARLVVIGISLIVTICLNLNTIVITKQLSTDKTLRDNIIAMAEKTVKNVTSDSTKKDTLSAAKFVNNDTLFRNYLKANYPYLIDTTVKNLIDTTTKKNKITKKDTIVINTSTEVYKIEYRKAVTEYLASRIQGLGLKIGYVFKNDKFNFLEVFNQNNTGFWLTILGWLLTMAALSFGAPFWFDLLVKLVNVRNVMKKPDDK